MTKIVAITGPTASGKSSLGIAMAERFGGEIVSADSVAVYRDFNIGSGKPSLDELARVPHHLISAIDPVEQFNAGIFARMASQLIVEISERGHLPLVVGGTGLYLRALISGLAQIGEISQAARDELQFREAEFKESTTPQTARQLHSWLAELDPESALQVSPTDIARVRRALLVFLSTGRSISAYHGDEKPLIDLTALVIALIPERAELYQAADTRVENMLRQGLVEETRELMDRYPPEAKPFSVIGYRHAVQLIRGQLNEVEMVELMKRDTRRYAKRQYTWWRHQPEAMGWEKRTVEIGGSGGILSLISEQIREHLNKVLESKQYQVAFVPLRNDTPACVSC